MMYARVPVAAAEACEEKEESEKRTAVMLEMQMPTPTPSPRTKFTPATDTTAIIQRSDNYRFLVAFIYFVASGTICAYSVSFGNDRMPIHQEPLRDLVFELTAPQFWALTVAEIILITQGVLTVIIVFLHKHCLKIVRRFFFNFGTVYLLRAVCLITTTLSFPGGDMKCAHSSTYSQHLENFVKVYISMGLSLFNDSKGFCGNYFFSGHTITITLQYLILSDYTPKSFYILRKLSALASITAVAFLVISRGHYTIDVLAAYYVTSRLWWNYHAIAWNTGIRNPRSFPPARELWYPLIQYLEQNSGNGQECNELCVSGKGNLCSRLCRR